MSCRKLTLVKIYVPFPMSTVENRHTYAILTHSTFLKMHGKKWSRNLTSLGNNKIVVGTRHQYPLYGSRNKILQAFNNISLNQVLLLHVWCWGYIQHKILHSGSESDNGGNKHMWCVFKSRSFLQSKSHNNIFSHVYYV